MIVLVGSRVVARSPSVERLDYMDWHWLGMKGTGAKPALGLTMVLITIISWKE